MGDLSKEQEQDIARSTMYLVAAVLIVSMVFIAGLFLSAELEQQALQKAETSLQTAGQQESTPKTKRPWILWSRHDSAMLPVKLQRLSI